MYLEEKAINEVMLLSNQVKEFWRCMVSPNLSDQNYLINHLYKRFETRPNKRTMPNSRYFSISCYKTGYHNTVVSFPCYAYPNEKEARENAISMLKRDVPDKHAIKIPIFEVNFTTGAIHQVQATVDYNNYIN